MQVACNAHVINLNLTTLMIFCAEYNSWSSSLDNFLRPPVFLLFNTYVSLQIEHTASYVVVLFVTIYVKYSVFKAAPPLPPSPEQALKLQAATRKNGFFLGLKRLLENRGFILLLFTYGLAVAVINSLGTLLNQLILSYFPVYVCVVYKYLLQRETTVLLIS